MEQPPEKNETPKARLLEMLIHLVREEDKDNPLSRLGNDIECVIQIKALLRSGEFVPTEEDVAMVKRLLAHDPSLTPEELSEYEHRVLAETGEKPKNGDPLSPHQEFMAFLMKLYLLTQKKGKEL